MVQQRAFSRVGLVFILSSAFIPFTSHSDQAAIKGNAGPTTAVNTDKTGPPTAKSAAPPVNQPPPAQQSPQAGQFAGSVPTQAVAATQAIANPLDMGARANLNQATTNALLLNRRLDDLVSSGKYSDKGLAEFREALAIKTLQPLQDLNKKDDPKPSENKDVPSNKPSSQISVSQQQINSNGTVPAVVPAVAPKVVPTTTEIAFSGTSKEAASFVKERVLEDLKKSQLVTPSTLQNSNNALPLDGNSNSTTAILKKLDDTKTPSIDVSPTKDNTQTRDLVGGTTFSPSLSNHEGSLSTSAADNVSEATKEKIKTAAKDYLEKLAKAPDSKSPKDRALQQAIRTALTDENVYDGLLNEITAAFQGEIPRITSFVPNMGKQQPFAPDQILSARGPASLDVMSDAAEGESNSPSLANISFANSKIPVLAVLSLLLGALVFWSTQSNPKKPR